MLCGGGFVVPVVWKPIPLRFVIGMATLLTVMFRSMPVVPSVRGYSDYAGGDDCRLFSMFDFNRRTD